MRLHLKTCDLGDLKAMTSSGMDVWLLQRSARTSTEHLQYRAALISIGLLLIVFPRGLCRIDYRSACSQIRPKCNQGPGLSRTRR